MPALLKPLKWYKQLSARKGRLEAAAFLVEGNRAINQIITTRPDEIIEILTADERLTAYHNYPVRTLTESQFHSICHTRTPQGIMAVVKMPAEISSTNLPDNCGDRILVLEDIQDPGNVGTLIRTAAAFDFSGVIMTEKCADPLAPKCVQSTTGTVLSVWIRRTKSYLELTQTLKDSGFTLIAADINGTAEPTVLHHKLKLLLVLGNEAAGLSEELLDMADYRLRLPIVPEKAESLNVGACGAILMYLSSQVIGK